MLSIEIENYIKNILAFIYSNTANNSISKRSTRVKETLQKEIKA